MTKEQFETILLDHVSEQRESLSRVTKIWAVKRNFKFKVVKNEKNAKLHGERSIFSKARILEIIFSKKTFQ